MATTNDFFPSVIRRQIMQHPFSGVTKIFNPATLEVYPIQRWPEAVSLSDTIVVVQFEDNSFVFVEECSISGQSYGGVTPLISNFKSYLADVLTLRIAQEAVNIQHMAFDCYLQAQPEEVIDITTLKNGDMVTLRDGTAWTVFVWALVDKTLGKYRIRLMNVVNNIPAEKVYAYQQNGAHWHRDLFDIVSITRK
jgi:hypothetical protein